VSAIFVYGMARTASICLSASVAAVDARLARLSATRPEVKAAAIAVIAITITVIAIRSSISPNPSCSRTRRPIIQPT
jgi:hypothetical protein